MDIESPLYFYSRMLPQIARLHGIMFSLLTQSEAGLSCQLWCLSPFLKSNNNLKPKYIRKWTQQFSVKKDRNHLVCEFSDVLPDIPEGRAFMRCSAASNRAAAKVFGLTSDELSRRAFLFMLNNCGSFRFSIWSTNSADYRFTSWNRRIIKTYGKLIFSSCFRVI